jgi:hypothetical protein
MSERPTVELDAGGERLIWEIDHITDGPEGRFLLFDTGGQPRLIVDGDELAQIQRGGFS